MSKARSIKHIGVVGMGLMGHGVAQLSASNGFKVTAVEIDNKQLTKGMKAIENSLAKLTEKEIQKGALTEAKAKDYIQLVQSRITPASDVSALKDCDLVIEAIIENLDIKMKFFTDLGKKVNPDCVLASNTSSFPITQMGDASGRPDKFVGIHFFNPVQKMQLVEVIRTKHTSQDTFQAAMDYCQAIQKKPVSCGDTPGFIVNRLLVPYISQALLMLDNGVASPEDIDVAMQFGASMPMGPVTLADYVGLDTCLSILQGWTKAHPNERAFVVPKVLEQMVAAGNYGRKSGKGFYEWKGDKRGNCIYKK